MNRIIWGTCVLFFPHSASDSRASPLYGMDEKAGQRGLTFTYATIWQLVPLAELARISPRTVSLLGWMNPRPVSELLPPPTPSSSSPRMPELINDQ